MPSSNSILRERLKKSMRKNAGGDADNDRSRQVAPCGALLGCAQDIRKEGRSGAKVMAIWETHSSLTMEGGGTLMEKLDQHDPHLADVFRRATLEREQQAQRLADLFGTQTVPKVTEETLAMSLAYLKQHLAFPFLLTGIESRGCFAWEASYIFGRKRPKEYAQRKKEQPSYTDTYAWRRFEEEYDVYQGLEVQVRRLSDNKQFVLPLAHLKATEGQSKNYQLLHDYVVWFVNWRR
jgi:hypothetical protein